MIYFDNSATTFIKPENVYSRVYEIMKKYAGNSGRSGHYLSAKANDIIYDARENVAEYFNISNPERVCFTPNATYALNFGIKGCLSKGDKVLISGFEHNAVVRPLYASGADVKQFPWFEYNEYDKIKNLTDDVKMIIVNHMSNVNGNIADINTIGKIAKEKNIIFMVDASQSAGHIDIDVQRDNVDILACAGHKGLFGPQGTGILYVKDGLYLKTLIEGGTGSQSEELLQPDLYPDRFESGTLNVAAIGGLAEGIKFLLKNRDNEYERKLARRMIDGLSAIPRVVVYNNKNRFKDSCVIAFNIDGYDCVSLSNYLSDRYNIMIRAGLHCAPLAHKTMGTIGVGCARVSLSNFNTENEVNQFLEIIDKISFL